MSRSYRKFPVVKDHNKGQKELANRKVRRVNKLDPLKGKDYKKLYPQWDICDYCWIWTREEAIAEWEEEESEHFNGVAWRHEEFKTLKNYLKYWDKCVRRK